MQSLDQLVIEYLELSNIPYTQPGTDLLEIELWVTPTHNPWEPEPEKTCHKILYTFSKDLLKEHPQAQLLNEGSQTFQNLLKILTQNGKISIYYAPVTPQDQSLTPHLLVVYRAQIVSEGPSKSWVFAPACDLVTGEITPQIIESAEMGPTTPPDLPVLKQRLRFKEAFQAMEDWIVAQLGQEETEWAQKAQGELEAETHRLNTYYEALMAEKGTEVETERARRLDEEEKRRSPRIALTPLQLAMLYLPTPMH